MRPGFVVPIFGKKGGEQEVQGGVRGAQVAQVNVQANEATGEILSLFIEVDLGYGRRVNIV